MQNKENDLLRPLISTYYFYSVEEMQNKKHT